MSAKPTFPGIPAIVDDRVLAPTVRALVEIVELLIGARGTELQAANATDISRQLSDIKRRLEALEP
jgi:hypothetical protein